MNHNKKKAFTLLELLVVIAIVAVLSAVAVVGYSSFKKKAYISNDSTLVEQMNKIVAGYEVLDERARNMSEAIEQCQDNGFILENLDPQTPGYRFVYDQENNRFSLMDEDFKVSFTDEQKPLTFIDKTEFNEDNKTTKENLNLFVILNDEKDWKIIQDYRTSVFLGINYDGEQFINSTTKVLDKDGNPLKDDEGNEIYYKTFTYNRGVDAGKNLCKYLTIVYDNTTKNEQITHEYPVVLRSSNLENLTIKSYVEESSSETSYCDTVYHYGSASNLNVINNGYHSVHEFGGAEKMTAPLGAVEFEDGCVIDVLIVDATNKDIDVDIDDGSQIGTLIILTSSTYENNIDIKSGAFVREIIIAGTDGTANTDMGKLNLTVDSGATVKASTKNDGDSSSSAIITGLPDTTPRTVQDTCDKDNPHIWATQPDLLVEFCKKCGARRTVEVIENSATKEVTETTTYTRADDTPKVQNGENDETINLKATDYANAVLGKATSSTAEDVYVVEEIVDVEIEKVDDKPTGKQITTIKDSGGNIISSQEIDPSGETKCIKHKQYNEETKRLYYNCPYCGVAFGTKDLPYSLTKPEHYQALLIYREFSSSGIFGIYREDDEGYLDWIYINLDADIDCSNVDTEGYYTYPEYMILNGNNHILSGLKGYCAFCRPYGQCYISDVIFKNCEFEYGMFYTVSADDDLYLNGVTYDDCDCTYYGGLVAFKIAGDAYIDECNFKNIDFTGAYAYGISYYMTGKLEITGSKFTNIKYYLNSYAKGLINSVQGPTTISNCVFDNIYGEHAIAYTVKNALTVSNCTIKNSNLESAIAYGNWIQDYSGTIMNITNTHVQDSTLRGGGFVYYQAAGKGNIAFTNCSITNSKVIGVNSMACGGFIGNCGSTSTFTNCTVDAEIENGNAVAAFVGQSSTNTSFINCSVSKNTTLCNKASGAVYAYASQHSTITGCTFEGIALTGSVDSTNGNGIVTFVEGTNYIKYPLVISASDFVIETDGTIKYTGSSPFGKMEIAAGITCDIYKDGQPSDQGGFLQAFCELEASNISGATTLGKLFIPKNLKVYVEKNDTYDDSNVCGNTILDKTLLDNGVNINLLFFKNDNVLYLKSTRTSTGISYVPSAFHSGATPVLPNTVWASVIVKAYDDNDNIKAVINLGFNINISK